MGETLRHVRTYICVRVDLGTYIRMNSAARAKFGGLEEYMTVNADQRERKSILRSALRAARTHRELAARADIDAQISHHICDLLETVPVTADSVVALYVAMPYEPSVNTVRKNLRELGVTVLVPVVSGDDLLWAADGDEESWERNSFGTLEPDPDGAISSAQALPACAAIIVPAQAIDPNGFRLGQGKGFYDRALAELAGLERPPLLIGVTFESEFLPDVPTQAHDIPVDASVTELSVRWFNTPD